MKFIEIEASHITGQVLRLIAHHRWMRPQELAAILFEQKPFAIKYAESICRRLVLEGLALRRKLPSHNGTAFLLSQSGAELVTKWQGIGFRSGKDWGRTINGVWLPPSSWRHDLIAHGLLAVLHNKGWECFPEHMLRREDGVDKYPDGLAFHEKGTGLWVEVEQARKSGLNMNHLITALYTACNTTGFYPFPVAQHLGSVNQALIGIVRHSKDERGYKLNHWLHIENAMKKRLSRGNKISLHVAWITLKGAGVGSVEFEVKTISGTQ